MSFAALSSRTLAVVSLFLISEGINGLQITESSHRRGTNGGGDGDDDGDDDDDDEGHTSGTGTHTHTSKTSGTGTQTHTESQTSHFSSATGTSNTPLPNSTSSSLPASATSNRLAESQHVGAIVGAVLGSMILVALGSMILAKYRSRARKARKRPRGSLPSTFFTDQPPQMSQAQNGPLVASPTALTSHPAPIQPLNTSPSNNTRTRTRDSLAPLFPAASLHNSQDTSSSAYHRLSTNDSDGSHAPSGPLQSHDMHDMQPSSSFAVPLPERTVFSGSTSSPTSGQPSSLHRDMAEFQMALVHDHKRHISNPDQSPIINDPPPKYVDNAATSSV